MIVGMTARADCRGPYVLKGRTVTTGTPKESEVERLLCDNTLIRELTGWSPAVSLEDGLRRTIDWFEHTADLSRYKSDIYNI